MTKKEVRNYGIQYQFRSCGYGPTGIQWRDARVSTKDEIDITQTTAEFIGHTAATMVETNDQEAIDMPSLPPAYTRSWGNKQATIRKGRILGQLYDRNKPNEPKERRVIETISPSEKSSLKVMVKHQEEHETETKPASFLKPPITPIRIWHRLHDPRR